MLHFSIVWKRGTLLPTAALAALRLKGSILQQYCRNLDNWSSNIVLEILTWLTADPYNLTAEEYILSFLPYKENGSSA